MSGRDGRSRSVRRGTARERTSPSSPSTPSASSSASSTATPRDAARAARASPGTSGTATSPASRPDSGTATASTGRTTRPQGHRFNPTKLLIDPYAKAIEGPVRWERRERPPVRAQPRRGRRSRARRRGRRRGDSEVRRDRPRLRLGGRPAARTPWHDTVIYEVHVKGFTRRHPEIRGRPARHVRGPRVRAGARVLPRARRHRRRAAPHPPHRRRGVPARPRAVELLGLLLHRLPRPARALRRDRRPAASRCASSRGW